MLGRLQSEDSSEQFRGSRAAGGTAAPASGIGSPGAGYGEGEADTWEENTVMMESRGQHRARWRGPGRGPGGARRLDNAGASGPAVVGERQEPESRSDDARTDWDQ